MADRTYQYEPLAHNQIRLLHLRPGDKNDSIFVEITHEELNGRIAPYTALSWQWGSETATETIRIENKGNHRACRLTVRRNLFDALKQLRHSVNTVRLWVDAVCINQSPENNDNEKRAQISLMTKIYGTAEEVAVWLGVASEDSTTAMGFVGKVVDLHDENHIAGLYRKGSEDQWAQELEALIKLLKRGWFSRRWVVQEIAMARKATLHCGNDVVQWNKLADAIALLEKFGRDGAINRILKKHAAKEGRASEYDGSFSSLPAYRLVQNTTGMFRGQDKKDIRTWRYTLEELVSFLAAFQASRLHDTVYALLGLASDAGPDSDLPQMPTGPAAPRNRANSAPAQRPHFRNTGGTFREGNDASTRIPVDYSLPALRVFKQFLKHAITHSQSLDIICRPWAPEEGVDADGNPERIKLPSWIPSLKRKPFRPTQHGDMVRFNPDPLVGPASFRHRFYQASGSALAEQHVKFSEDARMELEVGGFEIGIIGSMWDSSSFGEVPASWLKAGGWKSVNEKPPDELWRALVADRNAAGGDPDRWYPMAFQTAAKDRGIEYGFDTKKLSHESPNAMVAELFRRVEAVVWGRRLINVTGGFSNWLKENKVGTKREESTVDSSGDGSNGDAPTESQPGPIPAPQNRGSGREDTQVSESTALGLAPCEACVGDIVCIIFGCSVPLVLRKVPTTNNYTLIGECYLDHAMDGEAMTYFEKISKSTVEGEGMAEDGSKFVLQ